MVGSILRLSPDSVNLPGGRMGPRPYKFERRITAVSTSGQVINVDSSINADLTTVKYVISDPVDIDPSMTEAMLRNAERHTSIHRKATQGVITQAHGLYLDSLDSAKAQDQKVFSPRVVGQSNAHWRRLSSFPQGDDEV
jgi:hypothetical protein